MLWPQKLSARGHKTREKVLSLKTLHSLSISLVLKSDSGVNSKSLEEMISPEAMNQSPTIYAGKAY